MTPILTACVGTNAELLPKVFELYVKPGAIIADVTYGKGVFWKNIDKTKYEVFESDISFDPSIDFRDTRFSDASLDVLILDPPYVHHDGIKDSIAGCYKNDKSGIKSHEDVIRLYAGGILETARVLKKQGLILVKCQDEIESSKQRLSHIEIVNLLELFGFQIKDIFVLVQQSIPAMREQYQLSARKNHSYLIVAKFRR